MSLRFSSLSGTFADSEELASLETRKTLGHDPLNRKIIALLQEDGRASYMQISRELGVSEATVRTRVNQMVEARVLRFVGVPDPVALGYDVYALVTMKLAAHANLKEVSKRFETRDEVTYILFGTGRHGLVIEVVCETHEQLQQFIFDHCYGHDDIVEVEPIMALALNKYLSVRWGGQ